MKKPDISRFPSTPKLLLLAGTALTTIVCPSAHAAIVATEQSATTALATALSTWNASISAGDLINSGSSTFLNSSVTSTHGSFPGTGINNGAASATFADNTFFQVAPNQFPATATFNLNLSDAPLGYTITSIQSFMGWATVSAVQANQTYIVSVSTVSSGAAFTDLFTVSYRPFTDVNAPNYESRVVLTQNDGTNILASGVDSIRFTFLNPLDAITGVANGAGATEGTVVREIDIEGFATVPEPSSLACAALAGALLLRRRRD